MQDRIAVLEGDVGFKRASSQFQFDMAQLMEEIVCDIAIDSTARHVFLHPIDRAGVWLERGADCFDDGAWSLRPKP